MASGKALGVWRRNGIDYTNRKRLERPETHYRWDLGTAGRTCVREKDRIKHTPFFNLNIRRVALGADQTWNAQRLYIALKAESATYLSSPPKWHQIEHTPRRRRDTKQAALLLCR